MPIHRSRLTPARSLLWLPLIALLVFGCNDSPAKVTAPAADLPAGGDAVDLDHMAANLTAMTGMPTRCVQLRYLSEAGVFRTKQKGTNCTCSAGRPASVTAVIWNGAYQNNVIGKASCVSPTLGAWIVAGPTTAVDPGGVLGQVFGLTSYVGVQPGAGAPACYLNVTVNNTRDPSSRMVTCVWY